MAYSGAKKTPYGLVSNQLSKHSKTESQLSSSSAPSRSVAPNMASKAGEKANEPARKMMPKESSSKSATMSGMNVNNPGCAECVKRGQACTKSTKKSTCDQCIIGHRACPFVSFKRKAVELESSDEDEYVPDKAAKQNSDDSESDDESDGNDGPQPRRSSRTLASGTKQKSTTRRNSQKILPRQIRSPQTTAKGSSGASTSSASTGARPKAVSFGTLDIGELMRVDVDPQPPKETTGNISGKKLVDTIVKQGNSQSRGNAEKDTARFERLRGARNAFLERLKSVTAEGATSSDALDELYVLAMAWRTHEDLVWPNELR
ncbi:uncharacterized protein PHACADRAFT_184681 [Phanerochaete carnosa HHB-10118-sp]|uniref:Uncharacterized protein n=1 Tax=Phanerochaete carnosa (strain HHB-10118-sp) TaxID=650164 RepID=K5W9R9_PHACS|nr:uncharacterized protein PHACADRAFT_184681 [Phanerochaete carnosa HHB-10118-sp]EKM55950.1 hypothetical protein PHACADRAFT_184681 [Phanerochaete carnosa HHB-10118-sp]